MKRLLGLIRSCIIIRVERWPGNILYFWLIMSNELNRDDILSRVLSGGSLTGAEALHLYQTTPLPELMALGHQVRMFLHPDMEVTWQIDRNVNYSNVCVSGCAFCNFYRTRNHAQAYVLAAEDYDEKIRELFRLGGDQLLLQGGLHPTLGLEWFEELFRSLKQRYPALRLHALGPPEIHHLATREGMSYHDVLLRLRTAGLDSLPGAGAEILCDRVRGMISPAKCTSEQWLEVMRQAHRIGMPTSATMMFGHVETPEERVEHLMKIQRLQQERPAGSPGFLAFIPWPFQAAHTRLQRQYPDLVPPTAEDYLRLIAISRLVLNNVANIQASWLTVGPQTAQIALWAGANDLGSIMIEENVVSAAGSSNRMDAPGMQETIRKAGFVPRRRDQEYRYLPDPEPVL